MAWRHVNNGLFITILSKFKGLTPIFQDLYSPDSQCVCESTSFEDSINCALFGDYMSNIIEELEKYATKCAVCKNDFKKRTNYPFKIENNKIIFNEDINEAIVYTKNGDDYFTDRNIKDLELPLLKVGKECCGISYYAEILFSEKLYIGKIHEQIENIGLPEHLMIIRWNSGFVSIIDTNTLDSDEIDQKNFKYISFFDEKFDIIDFKNEVTSVLLRI